MKPFPFLLLFSLLFTCCNQKTEDRTSLDIQETAKKEEAPSILINNQGDTIPTGVPVPAQGKPIGPDSYPSPQFVPFETPPKIVPATNRAHPAQKLKVLPVPADLPIFTPGKDGVPLPKIVRAESQVTPVRQPKPINALPPRNDEASNFDIQYLSIDQGLSSSVIQDILEDSKGNLWIATWGAGLACYDGHGITHYTVAEGLATNYILSIIQGRQGHLWLGTMEGVIRFDGHHFTHYRIEGLGRGWHEGIHSMLIDREENLWIGTGFNGLIRFDGDSFTYFTTEEGLVSNRVSTIMEDSRGRLWIGTIMGMSRYDPPSSQTPGQIGSFTLFADKEGTLSSQVNGIVEDQQGYLWFGVGNRLTRFDGDNFTFFTAKEGFISTMMKDSRGNLWCGTWEGELFAFDGSKLSDYTGIETQIYTIIEDSGGNMLVATNGDGVVRLKRESFMHYTTKDGLIHNRVTKILEDRKGNLWYGTWGGGVCLYSSGSNRGEPGTYTHVGAAEPSFRWTYSILEGREGKIWIGGNQMVGVSRYEGNGWIVYPRYEGLTAGITSILEDSHRNIWFGTSAGLSRLNPIQSGIDQRERFVQFTIESGLGGYYTEPRLEDRQGRLWFIKAKGVSYYQPNGSDPSTEGTFTHITTNEGLSNNYILSMIEDSQGYFWFGTGGSGVCRYKPDEDRGRFSYLTTKEGLSNDYIRSIVEDKQKNIWMGTDKGITLLVPNAANSSTPKSLLKDQYKCITFDKADGLKRLDFQRNSVCLDRQDRIWWGTLNGVAMLDLNHFSLPVDPPKSVKLSYIEVDQNFVDYRGLSDTSYSNMLPFGKELSRSFDSVAAFRNYPINLRLPHHLNHLTFHFSAIDWAAPHKIRYSYRIKGLDKDWSPAQTEPKADYRNLPHGSFTLQVKAMGAAQIWSVPFEYRFIVLPPWYRTWWAYSLWVVIFMGTVYSIYRYQFRRQFALAEARRLKDLDQAKSRLYTNITHEFRTPLTIILGMAGQVKKDPQNWFNEGLNLIRRNGQQLLKLVNQLLDLSKLESGHLPLNLVQGDVISYLHYLTEAFHSYADSKDIRLHFRPDIPELMMDHDRDKLHDILSNLLSNAIKFTPAGGDVYVDVRTTNNLPGKETGEVQLSEILLQVSDTGEGITAEHLPHIFDRFYQADDSSTRRGEGTGIGLALTRELARAMGGRIDVESEPGKGTRFSIWLPVANKAPQTLADRVENSVETLSGTVFVEAGKMAVEPDVGPNGRYTVLLVEDNPDVVTYLSSVLSLQFRILTAQNGQEGIEKALKHSPDIIVSDVMMPGKDGFELCRELKTDERTSHIPIILLTARADQKSRVEGLTHGADAYLAKPFHQEELLVRLEKLIELRRRLRERFQQQGSLLPILKANPQTAEDLFLQKVLRMIESQMGNENFGMPQLCKEMNMSRANLFRKLKALTGKSATLLIRSLRLEKARQLLETTEMNVTEVSFSVGFHSPSYFARVFREEFGMAPSEVGGRS